MDALALSTTGQTVQGQLRLKMDEPFERATLVLKPGVSVPLTELFQLDEPSHRTALRVNRTPTADVCVTSASLSPEELAARLVPLAKGRGLLVEAARLSVR